jgi:hypothetical protein
MELRLYGTVEDAKRRTAASNKDILARTFGQVAVKVGVTTKPKIYKDRDTRLWMIDWQVGVQQIVGTFDLAVRVYQRVLKSPHKDEYLMTGGVYEIKRLH